MDSMTYSDELQHHGIKGMKWGQRRFQNKDGSLKPAGVKRYNKEVEKLKKETAKVKAAEKAAATRKKTMAKFDKLEEKKKALEERKKALKDEAKGKKPKDDEPSETPEQIRERLLKSSDAKELYKHKDLLSTQELNDRITRIDTEARLQSKIVEERKKTAMDYMDGLTKGIDKATALYKSVDNAANTVANSMIGKSLAKQLGIELETNKKDKFDYDKLLNKKNKTVEDWKTLADVTGNMKKVAANQRDIDGIKNNISENKKKKKDKGADNDDDRTSKSDKKAEKEAKKAAKKAAKEAERDKEKTEESKTDSAENVENDVKKRQEEVDRTVENARKAAEEVVHNSSNRNEKISDARNSDSCKTGQEASNELIKHVSDRYIFDSHGNLVSIRHVYK